MRISDWSSDVGSSDLLEESAVDDELTATVEQVEQAGLARRPLEGIGRLHGHPRHSPALGGQGVAGAGLGLFLHEQLLADRLPRLRRHHRWPVHAMLPAFASVLGRCSYGFWSLLFGRIPASHG